MYFFDVIEELKKCENFSESKNYYFQQHICEDSGQNIKIELKHKLTDESTKDIYLFGICDKCRTCFYHKDYESDFKFM